MAEDAASLDAQPHAFSGMLRAAEIDALGDTSPPTAMVTVAVDGDMMKHLVLIERAGGLTMPEAKIAARAALSIYATGMQAPQPSHLPTVPHEKIVEMINGLAVALDPQPAKAWAPREPAIG